MRSDLSALFYWVYKVDSMWSTFLKYKIGAQENFGYLNVGGNHFAEGRKMWAKKNTNKTEKYKNKKSLCFKSLIFSQGFKKD